MRIFEYSDFQWDSLPDYARADCMWEAGRFLENAANVLTYADMWTDALEDAHRILMRACRDCRKDAAKFSRKSSSRATA